MNIRIIWYLVNELKSKHNNVSITYGDITKNHRIQNGIEKSHLNMMEKFILLKKLKTKASISL